MALILHPDAACEIRVDTELHGTAAADTDYRIELEPGIYWVECRSTEDPTLIYDFDRKIAAPGYEERIAVPLLPALRLRKLKATYDFIGDFRYGYAEVRNNGQTVGYIDRSCQFCYNEVTQLCDNVLRVRSEDRYGAVDFAGNELLPLKYEEIVLLGKATLRLKLNGRFGLANNSGKKITPLKYTCIEDARNNIFACCFNEWHFVDAAGNEMPIPNNVLAYTTNDGMAIDIERKVLIGGIITDISFQSAFGQELLAHYYSAENGLFIFKERLSIIGTRAFHDCSSLTTISIPDSVTSIGWSAFDGCRSLTTISIPDSVTTIEWSAFDGCSSLTTISIPDSVTSIGGSAFRGCSSLTAISIPDSVTSIDEGAFDNCSSLTAFYGKFASEDARCLIIEGVLIAFAPKNVTEYTIPNGVTTIGGSAFCGCSSLTTLSIPDSVTSIGWSAFDSCSSLTAISIPDSVTSIGEGGIQRLQQSDYYLYP